MSFEDFVPQEFPNHLCSACSGDIIDFSVVVQANAE